MNELETINHAFKNFKNQQIKFIEFGAYDSDPEWVLHDLIRNAVTKGKSFTYYSANDWELFTDMANVHEVANELNTAAKHCHDLVVSNWGNPEIRQWVTRHCWRVDFNFYFCNTDSQRPLV